MIRAVDLFGGAGGWEVHCAQLGIDVLGIELDEQACATRDAAGLRTLPADVAALDPAQFAPCDLLIASPPCTAFSAAGRRAGARALGAFARAIREMAAQERPTVPAWLDAACEDRTAHLTLEPLRWALILRPTLMACEQVPPVLPLWRLTARALEAVGYRAWCGILEAERFGVPQTRERAILMASRVGIVHPPTPTHQRYVPGEPARHEMTLDGEVLPWVSMAQALGEAGAVDPRAYRLARGAGMNERYGLRRDTPDCEPAPVITSKARTATWEPRAYRNGNRRNAAVRDEDEPAPTVHFGHRLNEVTWVQRSHQTIAGVGRAERSVSDPALTIVGRTDLHRWVELRPATTVAADPRIAEPGHKRDRANPDSPGRMTNGVRVTVTDAAILQSFPADWQWRGSRTAQFRQIGNAIPPLLARAILSALLDTLGDR